MLEAKAFLRGHLHRLSRWFPYSMRKGGAPYGAPPLVWRKRIEPSKKRRFSCMVRSSRQSFAVRRRRNKMQCPKFRGHAPRNFAFSACKRASNRGGANRDPAKRSRLGEEEQRSECARPPAAGQTIRSLRRRSELQQAASPRENACIFEKRVELVRHAEGRCAIWRTALVFYVAGGIQPDSCPDRIRSS